MGIWNAERLLAFRRVEPSLRQSNPTRTKTHAMSGEHEILRRQRTVLDYPWASLSCRDHDQNRRMVEYMEIRATQTLIEMRWQGGLPDAQHMGLGVMRNSIKQGSVANNRERPRLLIDCARRVDCRIDQASDRLLGHRIGSGPPSPRHGTHRRARAHGGRALRQRSPCHRRLAATGRTQAATGICGFVQPDSEACAMTILAQPQLHQQFIDDCFSAIELLHRENKNPSSFTYLANTAKNSISFRAL